MVNSTTSCQGKNQSHELGASKVENADECTTKFNERKDYDFLSHDKGDSGETEGKGLGFAHAPYWPEVSCTSSMCCGHLTEYAQACKKGKAH
jgi:hypothetical protein